MRKLGSPRSDAFWVNFVTNLSGERIGVLPYERMDVGVLDATPEMIHNIPQPDFEAFVASGLKDDPNVEIRKGVAFVASLQTEGNVSMIVEERSTGAQWTVHPSTSWPVMAPRVPCGKNSASKVKARMDVSDLTTISPVG